MRAHVAEKDAGIRVKLKRRRAGDGEEKTGREIGREAWSLGSIELLKPGFEYDAGGHRAELGWAELGYHI